MAGGSFTLLPWEFSRRALANSAGGFQVGPNYVKPAQQCSKDMGDPFQGPFSEQLNGVWSRGPKWKLAFPSRNQRNSICRPDSQSHRNRGLNSQQGPCRPRNTFCIFYPSNVAHQKHAPKQLNGEDSSEHVFSSRLAKTNL